MKGFYNFEEIVNINYDYNVIKTGFPEDDSAEIEITSVMFMNSEIIQCLSKKSLEELENLIYANNEH